MILARRFNAGKRKSEEYFVASATIERTITRRYATEVRSPD
jgi:hypothetical protein